jgi:hypothetical protein
MPKDLAIRSRAAGRGQPLPNSREAIRLALSFTFAEYSSRLKPETFRSSRILAPSCVCSLDTLTSFWNLGVK